MNKEKSRPVRSMATAARYLMRATTKTCLATRFGADKPHSGATCDDPSLEGMPFASLSLTAYDYDGAPLLLLSKLSDHTRNLASDPRLSLLFTEEKRNIIEFPAYPGQHPEENPYEDPLSRPRLTVMGHAYPCHETVSRQRFLARHPACQLYADFADFSLYRVDIVKAHLIAGFARVQAFESQEFLLPSQAHELAPFEDDILTHMNDDHSDAIALYATILLGEAETPDPKLPWKMTGLDPDGCDLRRGEHTTRLEFPKPAFNRQAIKSIFINFAHQARKIAASSP